MAVAFRNKGKRMGYADDRRHINRGSSFFSRIDALRSSAHPISSGTPKSELTENLNLG